MYSPTTPTSTHPCIVYDICQAYGRSIELQSCSKCLRRLVGPDCSSMHLFNLNNRILLTHELLNDYTSAYTASETPFAAWVTVVARRYESQQSQHKFLSEQMFRAAWFAYITLQHLDGDMECPSCGPSPENTIWDGITLAFNQKHILPSLEPPTTVFGDSQIRKRTCYVYKQQLLPDKDLRKLVRRIISGPPPMPADSGSGPAANDPDRSRGPGGGDDSDDAAKSADKNNNELLARFEGISLAQEKLTSVNTGLGRLFTDQFGLEALKGGRWGNPVYRRFFVQVCRHQESNERMIMSYKPLQCNEDLKGKSELELIL